MLNQSLPFTHSSCVTLKCNEMEWREVFLVFPELFSNYKSSGMHIITSWRWRCLSQNRMTCVRILLINSQARRGGHDRSAGGGQAMLAHLLTNEEPGLRTSRGSAPLYRNYGTRSSRSRPLSSFRLPSFRLRLTHKATHFTFGDTTTTSQGPGSGSKGIMVPVSCQWRSWLSFPPRRQGKQENCQAMTKNPPPPSV